MGNFERRYLTEQEAADYIGVSKSSLSSSRRHGVIVGRFPPLPYIQLGRLIRYLKEDLDAAMRSARVAPSSGGIG